MYLKSYLFLHLKKKHQTLDRFQVLAAPPASKRLSINYFHAQETYKMVSLSVKEDNSLFTNLSLRQDL